MQYLNSAEINVTTTAILPSLPQKTLHIVHTSNEKGFIAKQDNWTASKGLKQFADLQWNGLMCTSLAYCRKTAQSALGV